VLTFLARFPLSRKIEEGKQFETSADLLFCGEIDSQLDIDAVRREDDVFALALKNGYSKLVTKLLDGVGKWNLHGFFSSVESIKIALMSKRRIASAGLFLPHFFVYANQCNAMPTSRATRLAISGLSRQTPSVRITKSAA
jgi:hypothetical protein